jgi:hypothetical protein
MTASDILEKDFYKPMTTRTASTLSMRRILLSLAIIALSAVLSRTLNLFIDNQGITLMFGFNIAAWILILYDWNLIGVHYNRVKMSLFDSIAYFLIGFLIQFLWLYVDNRFLHGQTLLSQASLAFSYTAALPAVLAGFSFCQAALVNVGFKCMTDHLNVKGREFLAILVSGFGFGLYYTLLFMPSLFFTALVDFSLTNFLTLFFSTFVPAYLYNVIETAFLAYLYNQSHSIIPGIVSQGMVYLVFLLLMLRG